LLSCIFSGLFTAPGIENYLKSVPGGSSLDQPSSLYDQALRSHQDRQRQLLSRTSGGENPYRLHQELGDQMTKAATVVRHNDQLKAAYDAVCQLSERALHCSLSDSGNWTNQNLVFTRALVDMFPLAKTILLGALKRDECRGAHFKPQFARKGISAQEPAEQRRQAEHWCDEFEANNRRWLKSTIADWRGREPVLSYEEVDTSLIPPRPRLYGLVGAQLIEEVWKERTARRAAEGKDNGQKGELRATAAKATT
jgi:succinate dehydrogenase / fumarate reductase flavoprotein subunit